MIAVPSNPIPTRDAPIPMLDSLRRDNLSHLQLSSPEMCTPFLTSRPKLMTSRVKTIDAFVTSPPLGLFVSAHVNAVTLSPLTSTSTSLIPRSARPISPSVHPMYSAVFWNEESKPNPKPLRSTAPYRTFRAVGQPFVPKDTCP